MNNDPSQVQKKVFKTHDLSIAAFLLMRGQVIIRADKSGYGGRYVFEFDDQDGKCQIISMEFLTSECSVYDGFIRTLRGMIQNS